MSLHELEMIVLYLVGFGVGLAVANLYWVYRRKHEQASEETRVAYWKELAFQSLDRFQKLRQRALVWKHLAKRLHGREQLRREELRNRLQDRRLDN